MHDAIVIIPTYNEIENIEAIIDAVFNQCDEVHILVVDDNSPDKTAQKVESYQSKYSDRLFLVKRNGKQGLGTAYVEGFKWCLKRDYEFVFEDSREKLYKMINKDEIDILCLRDIYPSIDINTFYDFTYKVKYIEMDDAIKNLDLSSLTEKVKKVVCLMLRI